ncbi:equilibrative nucleobase transporter 1-like [Mya arenaria]|uniref:equilibrative nucleobase transporter 1-like n=1 Tax=Mya arenaria TaxID=6604 RepID=UPI0022E951B4|nr:equilibrative nucleobase transporter 1-like [Mya arenaria]
MSLIVIIRNILMFPLGVFLDRYGTSRTRLISMCLIALGSLTMLFSSNVHPWLIFPALLMIGVSGMIVLITDLQVANLFGARRLTVMSILVGSSQSGGLVILFMKLTRETDVTLQTSFMFISIGFVPVLISTIAMLPRSRIPWPLPANYGKSKGMESDPKAWRRRISVGAKRKGDITDILPFIRTKLFLFMIIWLSLLSFKSLAFDLNIDVHLEKLGIVETEQYLSMFAMCMLLCLPLSFMIGILMDCHSNRVQQNHVQQMRNILNAICVNYIISLASSVTSLFPSFGLQTIAYILVAAEKVTLYATLFAFLTHVHFPAEHFGKLTGVAISVSGVVLVFQYPLRILVNSGLSTNMFYTKIILLVLILISGCHPVSVWYHIRTGQIHNQTEYNENDKAVNMVMIDKGDSEEQATNMNAVATSGAESDSAKPKCLQITDL